MRPVLPLLSALCACSETGLSEVEQVVERGVEDPQVDAGEDGDPTGGWGAWSTGSVPDLYVVMAVFGGSFARPSQVLVVDLRGQILARWEPPAGAGGLADTFVREVRPAGPGEVLVTTDSSFGWGTRLDAPPGERPVLERGPNSQVWRGDLVRGTWERVLGPDGDPPEDGVSSGLPEGWTDAHIGHFLPGPEGELLALGTPLDCTVDAPIDWLRLPPGLPYEPVDDEAIWEAPVRPALWRASAGESADGAWTALLAYVDLPCTRPFLHLDRWTPGAPAERLAEVPYDRTLTGLRWHPESGAALLTAVTYADDGGPPTSAEVRWLLDQELHTTALPEASYVQPVALLDPEVGAWAYTAWNEEARRDEIVIRAGGREVWRIEELRDGLGRRGVQVFDAIVVPAP